MATRLRKPFAYPSDDEDLSDDLDETQQDQLISSLRTSDTSSTQFYKRAFLPLPILASILYLPSLVLGPTRKDAMSSLLSITSLLSTAWILHFFPPTLPQSELKGKKPIYAVQYQAEGPIEEYLPWLNGLIGAVLGGVGFVEWRGGNPVGAWWKLIPAIVFAVVMFARRAMRPLDVQGLERLRYQYKGA